MTPQGYIQEPDWNIPELQNIPGILSQPYQTKEV
jgi:hypothetical protein